MPDDYSGSIPGGIIVPYTFFQNVTPNTVYYLSGRFFFIKISSKRFRRKYLKVWSIILKLRKGSVNRVRPLRFQINSLKKLETLD